MSTTTNKRTFGDRFRAIAKNKAARQGPRPADAPKIDPKTVVDQFCQWANLNEEVLENFMTELEKAEMAFEESGAEFRKAVAVPIREVGWTDMLECGLSVVEAANKGAVVGLQAKLDADLGSEEGCVRVPTGKEFRGFDGKDYLLAMTASADPDEIAKAPKFAMPVESNILVVFLPVSGPKAPTGKDKRFQLTLLENDGKEFVAVQVLRTMQGVVAGSLSREKRNAYYARCRAEVENRRKRRQGPRPQATGEFVVRKGKAVPVEAVAPEPAADPEEPEPAAAAAAGSRADVTVEWD